jgi:hypothetical protein
MNRELTHQWKGVVNAIYTIFEDLPDGRQWYLFCNFCSASLDHLNCCVESIILEKVNNT